MIAVQRHAAAAAVAVEQGRSLTPTLAQLWAQEPGLTAAQRGAIQDLAFGVCRWRGTLDALIELLLHKPIEHPRLRALLLVALYQLEWTRAPDYAVVDSAVHACAGLGHPAARGLVNAVLRSFLRDRVALLARARESEVGRWSYPQWWIDAVRRAWPAQFEAILAAGNTHPPMSLRVNARTGDAQAYLRGLQESGLGAQAEGPLALRLERPMPMQALPGYAEGRVSVQDLGAQYAGPLLDLRDGQRVLDACSAPGGKAAQILELAQVRLLALDRDAARLARVRENLERLRLVGAELRAADAGDPAQWWDGVPFDRILLDAPCTASGVVRRHPDAKWLRRAQDIDQLAREQARLLVALWRTLAPGGKLLYVTCSLFPAETCLRVDAFLAEHGDASRLTLELLPEPAGQLLPDPRHDGFYYALLHKRAADGGSRAT
jgi:16S rRNA (cytosine967-C5)-methyltransferase